MSRNVTPFARGVQPPTREGLQGPTGLGGWVGGWADVLGSVPWALCMFPPLQPPAGTSGPASLEHAPLGVGTLALGGPGITHPVYPPWYHPYTRTWDQPDTARPRHARLDHGTGTPGTCTYGRFETPVGEPRGIKHTRVFRVPGWFILVCRVYTAV